MSNIDIFRTFLELTAAVGVVLLFVVYVGAFYKVFYVLSGKERAVETA